MPKIMKSTTPCPLCLELGVVSVLQRQEGQVGEFCARGHSFNDKDELLQKISEVRAKFPEKFPQAEKGAATAPEDLPPPVLDKETLKTLVSHLGVPITGSSDLCGAVWSKVQDLQTANQQIQKLQARLTAATMRTKQALPTGAQEGPEGTFAVTVPELLMPTFHAYAEQYGMDDQSYAQKIFGEFLEQYFAMPAGYGS